MRTEPNGAASSPIDGDVAERVPAHLRARASSVVAAAEQDQRLLGVVVGGSVASGTADEHSDLDLVLVCSDTEHSGVLAQAPAFAARVGPLLSCFTGEHVGEPRLLIALYGPPLEHVDLKFVALRDLGDRVENGLLLWQRDDSVARTLAETTPAWPRTDPQWVEDRFWVWVHYVASKIERGELLEAVDALTAIRGMALAPLIVGDRTDKPSGVRRIESLAPEHADALAATVARPDADDCARALRSTIGLYRVVRDDTVRRREGAEAAVLAYLDERH